MLFPEFLHTRRKTSCSENKGSNTGSTCAFVGKKRKCRQKVFFFNVHTYVFLHQTGPRRARMKEEAKMWNSPHKGKQKRELSKGKFNRTEIYIYIYIYIFFFMMLKKQTMLLNRQ